MLRKPEIQHYGPRANENFPLFSYLSDSKNQTIIDKVLWQMIETIKANEFRFKFLELVIWINLDAPSKARNHN